jgi:hypothetical protein
MKINHILAGWLMLAALFTLTLQPSTASAQGTAFTYQGRLDGGGTLANQIIRAASQITSAQKVNSCINNTIAK